MEQQAFNTDDLMNSHKAGEVPIKGGSGGYWGSDVIADLIRKLGFQYVALNPGSSFRGLHDSLVNHLHNVHPQMLLCLHEEHAVSIAHGWAKVTGRPMAVVLHANVGLMHAAMAIYNAWCDRVPVLILGATGPVDAALRRPWIDWIHTSKDQASIVRPYIKWDDQPASLESSISSLIEAKLVAETYPQGPTYVCLDVSVQESAVDTIPHLPDVARIASPALPEPSARELDELLRLLDNAMRPVLMMGRMSRSESDWMTRLAVAQHCGAQVITDIKTGATFPTEHPLHVGPSGFFVTAQQEDVLRAADLIVCLDWVDAGTVLARIAPSARVVNVSMDHVLKNGWSYDQGRLVLADLHIASAPDLCLRAMARKLDLDVPPSLSANPSVHTHEALNLNPDPITMAQFAAALDVGFGDVLVTLVRLPLGWDAAHWHFQHPLDFLGYDGGAGIGSGPGMLIGAALALKDSDRIPVAVLGDGDTMMGISALWTAAHYGIPMLVVVCNNRSYFNDEIHQEKVAIMRNRPVENKSIGQAMTNPDIDFAQLAQAQGLIGIGPVVTPLQLSKAIEQGIAMVKQGKCVLIDARVKAAYAQSMSASMTASKA
jgi:thiamine pyrophosphate-dependent acetolactate synthase large subunit-like protein